MPYEVTALRKSIAVLRVLAKSTDAVGVTELARQAGVSKNMAFRICQTLCAEGWLLTEEGSRYRLTLTPFHVFAKPLERAQLTTACIGPLQALASVTGQTAYISVLDGKRAVHVQVIEGQGAIRVAGAVGHAFPLHATAQGKVFLAWNPALAQRVLCSRLTANTAKTLVDPRRLERQLAEIRQHGYALNREEYISGMVGCAAPIRDRRGHVVAAVGIFAPTGNLDLAALRTMGSSVLCRTAYTISVALGHTIAGSRV
ncbi:MAG: IclR family transcriptional regulator [Planctomycetota bacterium]